MGDVFPWDWLVGSGSDDFVRKMFSNLCYWDVCLQICFGQEIVMLLNILEHYNVEL